MFVKLMKHFMSSNRCLYFGKIIIVCYVTKRRKQMEGFFFFLLFTKTKLIMRLDTDLCTDLSTNWPRFVKRSHAFGVMTVDMYSIVSEVTQSANL